MDLIPLLPPKPLKPWLTCTRLNPNDCPQLRSAREGGRVVNAPCCQIERWRTETKREVLFLLRERLGVTP